MTDKEYIVTNNITASKNSSVNVAQNYSHINTDEEPYITCICKGISKNCVNPDSYGYICVRCNQCGRFDENKTT